MGYISLKLHVSLTIKHKKVLGATGLLGLLWNMETALRLENCQVKYEAQEQDTTRNQTCVSPAFSLQLSRSLYPYPPLWWLLSVCLSCFSFPMHPWIQAAIWVLTDILKTHCPAVWEPRQMPLLCVEFYPWFPTWEERKISSRCCSSLGRVLFIAAVLWRNIRTHALVG